jgi:putative oxidoreductase
VIGVGNLAALVLRVVLGGLMTGHGAQKLFGWWGGYGLEGTSAWLESMGLRPGRPWAVLAGGSEFAGGVLSLLGLLNPLGSLGVIGAMATATRKAHWGKPVWVTEGGPELPVTNMSIATALMLAGPGKYSFDRALGIRLPRWIALLGLVVVAITVALAAKMEPPAQEGAEQARDELQAEDEDRQQS